MLGLDKKKLTRYLAFGEDGSFFETPTGIVVRKYTSDEYDKPSLVLMFNTVDELVIVKKKLDSIDKDSSKALLSLCKEEERID